MKLVSLLILASTLHAASTAVEAGSRAGSQAGSQAASIVQARLLNEVSTATSRVGDHVRVVIVSGAFAGHELSGVIEEVQPAQENRRAGLKLTFKDAELVEIDNAREQVDESGRIVGILASDTLAGVLRSLGVTLTNKVDAEIRYPAGTDLHLRLTGTFAPQAAARTGQTAGAAAPSSGAALSPGLIDRIQDLPLRTMALRPRLPSDLTNVLFEGAREDVEAAFEAAGWTVARELNAGSVVETAIAIIEARGYHEAPVSTLLLDGRAPDMVFQKMTNTFAKRHHVRIWRIDATTWIGAGTHDIGLAFAPDERAFYHTIHPEVDRERRKIVDDLVFAGRAEHLGDVDREHAPRRTTNATGDPIVTDGKIAVLRLVRP